MKIKIEYAVTGPLAHRPTLTSLREDVEKAQNLDEAADIVRKHRLTAYRGGSHVAVHAADDMGRLVPGRLAIISEHGQDAEFTRNMIDIGNCGACGHQQCDCPDGIFYGRDEVSDAAPGL